MSGKPWQTFVSERLLQPLGMTCTTFTIADMLGTSEPAVPYSERRDGSELTRAPYYDDGGGVAPAGGMNSSVVDMSHWLIALLNGGVYNGTQVIPRDVIRETLAPSIALPNTDLETRGWTEMLGTAYGMGRYTGSYRGHFIAYHGGDIRGFHSQVSLMPRDSIGVIVMVIGDHAAPLYNVVTWNIYERLLGLSLTPWSERFECDSRHRKAGARGRARQGAPSIRRDRQAVTRDRGLRRRVRGFLRTACSRSRRPTGRCSSTSIGFTCRSRAFATIASTRPTMSRMADGR